MGIAEFKDILERQNEILAELWDVICRQREALKTGRISDIQDLMSQLRHVTVRCQAIETKRARAADELASEYGCEPIISEIMQYVPDEESESLSAVVKKLSETIGKLRIEMTILPRLMDEARTLNELMITEWRKLSQKAMGGATSGGFVARI